jgi:uncharacterized protein (DUF58 family)
MREDSGAKTFTEAFSFFSVWPVKFLAGCVLFFALVQADLALALPAAGCLCIGFAADLWARLAFSRLSFSLRAGRDRVFPGEELELVIELENMKLLPVWLTLELPLPSLLLPEEGATGGRGFLTSGLRLLSREKSRRILRLEAARRGVARPGPARISAGDILGLSSRTRSFAAGREIVVFPRRLRLKTLNIPFQEYFGAHAARGPVEDPAWYAGTRDYTGTRPAKNIHWKASARLGTLQEKLYEPTLQRKLLFILDAAGWDGGEEGEAGEAGETNGAMKNFERMMETLAALASALAETGASFGLATNARLEKSFGGVLPSGRGPEHLGALLEMLARVTGMAETGFADVLRGAAREYAGFVYCGGSPGERALRVCREISGKKKILCVFAHAESGDTPTWEGFPSCRMEELCGEPW